jgi:hypothetical protein
VRLSMQGARTIEHGTFIDDASIKLMAEKGVYLVPTLYVGDYLPQRATRQRGAGEDERADAQVPRPAHRGRRARRSRRRQGRSSARTTSAFR